MVSMCLIVQQILNYSIRAELTVRRRACDLQGLVDGIAGNWAFVIRLPTQRGGDVGGEVLEKVTLQLHTVEFKFNV